MPLKPGTRLGPYEILGLLGAGGMGEVYKGRDVRLDRLVALKLLAPHLTHHPESRDRFEREATTIANLKHAHICVLYDIGKEVLPVEAEEAEEVSPSRDRERAANQSRDPEGDREGADTSPSRAREQAASPSWRTGRVDYLVLEYLEGETLSQRLARGPLPLAEAMQYAVEIADALDKAHRAGVTHRDIKPGNIMLVPTSGSHGMVSMPWARSEEKAHGTPTVPWLPPPRAKMETKLLDFGLAKLKQEVAKATIPASERPTIPGGALTQDGTILGTLHYMAPEQLESKEVDGRADIFSFGAVVHEMVTGKKAFPGETQASIIAKILDHDPPPVSSLEPPGKLSPPALDRVVERCLAKDREDRWQAMRDVCHELQWVGTGGKSHVSEAKPTLTGLRRAVPLSVAGLIAAVVAVVIGVAVWQFKPPPAPAEQAITRFALPLASGERLTGENFGSAVALSPDGKRLVYAATGSSGTQLYLRTMDSAEARPIPGTQGASTPFFSPDGEWIGFWAASRLKKVAIQGGAPVDLSASPNLRGAAWGANDTIVLASFNIGGLSQIPAAGGAPKPLTTPDAKRGQTSHRWPEFLPGGKAVLFAAGTIGGNWDAAQIVSQRLDTGEQKVLVEGGTSPRYVSGHLVYARAGVLMAAPFDPERLEVTGSSSPIVDGVSQSQEGFAQFSVSSTGSLVYVPGGSLGAERTLAWVDRAGAARPLPAPPRPYEYPSVSPDGLRVSVRVGTDIWVYDIPRETLTRLTFEGVSDFPIWTPDGKRVTFQASRSSSPGLNVFLKNADGTGTDEQLTRSEFGTIPLSWSPDGQVLAFAQLHPTNDQDIWLLPLQGLPSRAAASEGDRKPRPFLQTPFFEAGAKFSQDGRYLAYVSQESGTFEVHVQPVSGPTGKWQISTEGGREIAWSRSGREIFYRNGNKMMVVDVRTEPTFTAGRPRLLFEGGYRLAPGRSIAGYDVAPDGQRFLMIQEGGKDSAPTQINVVLNWFEELKRRVPAGR